MPGWEGGVGGVRGGREGEMVVGTWVGEEGAPGCVVAREWGLGLVRAVVVVWGREPELVAASKTHVCMAADETSLMP